MNLPILYSFRRCPYAMRARMALWVAGIVVELREVKLAAKPPELIAASPKGTVPVLVLADGTVIDQSMAIMRWALAQNDPEGWLAGDDAALIVANDGPFKHHLDRAKYPGRYVEDGVTDHRAAALALLAPLELRLQAAPWLCGESRALTDIALFPFIRQFAAIDSDGFAAQPLPRLQQWLARLSASALFASIMPKFAPWTAGDAPVAFGTAKTRAGTPDRVCV
jgi:glutathione S-transferase